MIWINFLHCYQPAFADAHVIKDASEKCYRPLFRLLLNNPRVQFTFNITGCLFLRLEQLGYFDIIDNLKTLLDRGQIEITDSAAYHPILPLVSEREVRTQIKENQDILHKFLGASYHQPKGFYLPEMAYSLKVAKIVKSLGYQWLILDEIAACGRLDKTDTSQIYLDSSSGLKIIFRNRALSKDYVPKILLEIVDRDPEAGKKVVVTATDCEIYGLRHIDYSKRFLKLISNPELTTTLISLHIKASNKIEKIKPMASSWESTEKELTRRQPYILWYNKNNPVHKKLWQLAKLASQAATEFKNDNNHYWVRWHLIRGLASCTFWWASGHDFKLFSTISWSPDEIERGTNELIRAIRSIDSEKSRRLKIKGEKLHIDIKKLIWQRHWTDYWKK